jgi:hypothetical protein
MSAMPAVAGGFKVLFFFYSIVTCPCPHDMCTNTITRIFPPLNVLLDICSTNVSVWQATRGGRVKLAALAAPPSDYNHEEKGDALYAMELALALEKLNFKMLFQLHEVAEKHNDANFTDFVEEMLAEQVSHKIRCLY